MSRRAGVPDPMIGNICYAVKYSVHLESILLAAGLPPTLKDDTASNHLSEHGFYKDGCRKLLPILESIKGLADSDLLKMVRAYNLKNDPLRHEERELQAQITRAVSRDPAGTGTGTGGNSD